MNLEQRACNPSPCFVVIYIQLYWEFEPEFPKSNTHINDSMLPIDLPSFVQATMIDLSRHLII